MHGIKTNSSHIMLVPLCVFATTLAYDALGGQGNPPPAGGIDSPKALADYIRGFVCAAPPRQLDLLAESSDPTVALAAGWERVRRKTPATTEWPHHGLVDWPDIPGPQKADLARFLRLVGNRTGLPIPGAWRASVGSAKYYRDRKIWFPNFQYGFPLMKAVVKGALGKVIPRRAGSAWIVDAPGLTLSVPAQDPRDDFEVAKTLIFDDKAIVALYYVEEQTFRVFAEDRSTGKVLWSSPVSPGGELPPGTFGSGPSFHSLEIVLKGDKVGFFGVGTGPAYLEVFNAHTGERICRFSTAYFPDEVNGLH